MRLDQAVRLNVFKRRSFTHASVRGQEYADGAYVDAGKLAFDDLDQFKEDQPFVSYVVFSYQTPIAWYRDDRGWHFVEQKFSQTTTRHQNLVRQAAAFADRYAHSK